jgi:tetratricopeptide (TPR) repeat protein
MAGRVFISHSSKDDAVVEKICHALRGQGIDVWDDARQLAPGDQLELEIRRALDESRATVVVLSPRTINSKWVPKEIQYAEGLRKQRGLEYRIIPVMLDGVEPTALHLWFTEEPVGLKVKLGPGGIQDALPELLVGLGLRLPSGTGPSNPVQALPIADLTLELSDPYIDASGGKHRGAGAAELIYRPPEPGAREVRSRRFTLVAPIGPIEAEELRWYLERYVIWPSPVFQERARRVEKRLPEWGRMLHAEALEHEHARGPYEAWKLCGDGVVRRLTVLVDRELIVGSEREKKGKQAEADEAATLLLGLPWELLHDDEGYLFLGRPPARVRRRLPNRKSRPAVMTDAPIRVLLLSPRPEDEAAGYIDHRVSARPVVEALSSLGDLAKLTLLNPPTFAALAEELDRARRRGEPYHVVHFDGHGVYSRQTGLGALCFEHAEDIKEIERRRSDIVEATKLAEVMRDLRVPLFFLEACQTAVAEKDPTASVAGTLLQGGVASVIAMSHAVLVETARRFVSAFYQELLAGHRIGEAMVAGQRALKLETIRYRTFQGKLHLEDWFVPVLYQEEEDPQIIRQVPARQVREVLEAQHEASLGELPEAPEHGFLGRSRELLMAERLLGTERYVVLCGEGGEGKTTLAAELVRWLVATRRYERVVFASLEKYGDARALMVTLGSQLIAGYASWESQDEHRAWLVVERELREQRTLVVLDNMESVLPPEQGAEGEDAFEPEVLKKVLELAEKLSAVGATRVVFTSRQPMPSPFDANHVTIGRLGRRDAIDLVARVLGRQEQAPRVDDLGESEDELSHLVEAVGCHARSLVLVTREVANSGVVNATRQLGELMTRLQARYPGDRERSLYASVELSLRRLPIGMRKAIRPLGVFQGGGHLFPMELVLGLDPRETQGIEEVATALVRVGLAEMIEYGYLRLDPALGPLLLSELSEAELAATRHRWAAAMARFVSSLYSQQHGNDPRVASVLALLDVPNLLGALEYLGERAPAELVVRIATSVESLLQLLGRPKALARASRVRHAAASSLGEWSRAKFLAEGQEVDRLLETGRFQEAIELARTLVARVLAVGETADENVAYDLALAQSLLGRALQKGGNAKAALVPLREALGRFQAIADGGSRSAARMVSVLLAEMAICLSFIGRVDEAASASEEAIRRAEHIESARDVAIGKVQLGMVRLLQQRYDEALAAYAEARKTFEQLDEQITIASMWHQIGMVYQLAGHYDDSENAYHSALRIRMQIGDRPGEADTLGQLGTLYSERGQFEEAVRVLQRVATLYRERHDLANEGRTCSNLAGTFVMLGRYDDARRQVHRAIECDALFGYAAEPWKTFDILAAIEREAGDRIAAEAARQRAIDVYMAYRRDGGQNRPGEVGIVDFVAQGIESGQGPAAEAELTRFAGSNELPELLKPLLPKLQAILRGARAHSLADDPDLNYAFAVELKLLLEHLARSPGA